MKRQMLAFGLAAVSALGTLSLAAPVQAIQDRELNGTQRPQDIGKVSSVPVKVSGRMALR